MSDDLQQQFAELVPFLATWARSCEHARSEVRWKMDAEGYEAFYAAMMPRLDELLTIVDRYELGALPSEVLPFYHLLLAFAEAAPHSELYGGSNRVPNSFDAARFVAAHGLEPDA